MSVNDINKAGTNNNNININKTNNAFIRGKRSDCNYNPNIYLLITSVITYF